MWATSTAAAGVIGAVVMVAAAVVGFTKSGGGLKCFISVPKCKLNAASSINRYLQRIL